MDLTEINLLLTDKKKRGSKKYLICHNAYWPFNLYFG